MTRVTVHPKTIELVESAINDIRNGKMVVLVDDEDRENEGDLVFAAEMVTPDLVNFMATHARGLICLAMDGPLVDRLQLPMMVSKNNSPLGTNFTVSIEAKTGVTTGISVHDRARTIAVAIDPKSGPGDVVSPGHIFPLRACPGGVLQRTGQTEGAVDLARMAGLTPAGVICEIMNDDGTMARRPQLDAFTQKHRLLLLSVADLIQYRLTREPIVQRVQEGTMQLPDSKLDWRYVLFQTTVEQQSFVALIAGDIEASIEPVICRVHAASNFLDAFAPTNDHTRISLRKTVSLIDQAGKGVILYVPSSRSLQTDLDAFSKQQTPLAMELRQFGFGAQCLANLGLSRIRLVTRSAKKIHGLSAYGIEVAEVLDL
jgi:3,4-dihydroxy 2-butanone 4-phosphate synthase/GTP cyclohydrolase II